MRLLKEYYHMGMGHCPHNCANCSVNYRRSADLREKFRELPDRQEIKSNI